MSASSTPSPQSSVVIDREQVFAARKKFMQLNQQRWERARDALEYEQQTLVDLLPLLFHVNHPMLPGYVSQSTPCGLSHYQPDTTVLRQAKKFARSFRHQPINNPSRQIFSIFVMGSMGTLGQSRGSDLDIWLCYDPQLTSAQVDELQRKCQLISDFAKQQRLELCFFPTNNESFKAGQTAPLSDESSGSTQHHLLLDEFYRSAIHLGGRVPLWWLVPSHLEQHYDDYCRTLLKKRFVREDEVIDLGGLTHIPPREFITAAIWQMYKAIQSPYKSMLKLMLLEVYAHQYPKPLLLAHQFKQKLERNRVHIDELDPYLLLLQCLETYLQQRDAHKRIEMARRCFYFKVDKALSRPANGGRSSWQRRLLQDQVEQWQWTKEQLQFLDNRRQWRVTQVAAERQRLVNDLLNSYRVLTEFVRQQNDQPTQLHSEVTILGRKLYAAFERKAGKIEWINPDISPDISEPHLLLRRHRDEDGVQHWKLYAQPTQNTLDSRRVVKSSRSAVELLVWAYCNGVLTGDTDVRIPVNEANISLRDLYTALCRWQPLPLSGLSQSHYANKPYAQSLLLICNLEDPANDLAPADEEKWDSFNLQQQSLINDIHLGVLNSWNETLVTSPNRSIDNTAMMNGDSRGLPQLITEILALTPPSAAQVRPNITIVCRHPRFSQQLKQRIEGLLKQLIGCFHSGLHPHHSRFVLIYAGRYHCWQYQSQLEHREFEGEEGLQNFLAQPQAKLSPIFFDRQTLQTSPLHAMSSLSVSNAIQIGYRQLPAEKGRQPQAEVLILDERNSLVVRQLPFRDEQSLLRPLHQFIRSAVERLCLTEQHAIAFGVYPVEFYRLLPPEQDRAHWFAQRTEITTELNNLNFFNIQAILSGDPHDPAEFSFYCDDQEFHSLDYGEKIYRRVASYILARRRKAERYPCYLTDLDLSRCHSAGGGSVQQTSEYLTIKARLEQHLNQALQNL